MRFGEILLIAEEVDEAEEDENDRQENSRRHFQNSVGSKWKNDETLRCGQLDK